MPAFMEIIAEIKQEEDSPEDKTTKEDWENQDFQEEESSEETNVTFF